MKIENRCVTLIQTGFYVEGYAKIALWGGGHGYIKMNSFKLKNPCMSIDRMEDELESLVTENINDGGFGCESIDGAVAYVYDLYEHSFILSPREIVVGNITSEDYDMM